MENPARILVVDDDPAIRTLFSRILREQGYEVLVASTGQEALDTTRARHPDLVLLDVRLPDLSGMEVCQRIKTDPALPDVFVALISGEATSPTHKVDGLETGADDYIAKPLVIEEFLARIRTLVRLRHTTAALRVSERHYRRLLEILPDAVFLIDQHARLQSVNDRAAAMLGYTSPRELLGKTAFELTPPEQHERIRAEIAATLKSGILRDADYAALSKEGHRLQVELSAAVSEDGNGPIPEFVVVARDVTARKTAETRIRELLHILDHAHDAIIIRDLEGRIQYFNQGAEQLLGWSADEVRGQLSTDLFFDNAEEYSDANRKLRQTGEWDGELHILTKDRRPLVIHSRWTLVHLDTDQPPHVVCINTDVTDRKWTEHLVQMQRDFSAFMSTANDLKAAAERLLEVALQNDGVDCGGVYLFDLETSSLNLVAHRGLSPNCLKHVLRFDALPANIGQTACWQHREPMAAEGLLTVEAVPIKHDGKLVAVLNIGSHLHTKIPAIALHAIETIVAQAGGAIARIRAEQLLRNHRQLLEKTLHSLRAAVLIIDAETTLIQECNPATSVIFGFAREELIGKSPAILHIDEAARAQFVKRLHSEVKKKGFLNEFEFQMRRKDGTAFPTGHSVMPIRNEAGRIVSWVSVVRDISEQKRNEQELRERAARIIQVQEAERLRLARDLHDGVNQIIASARMRLHKVEESIANLSPASREMMARCHDLLAQAIEENRRVAHNLRPSDLDELGLAAACRNLCDQIQSRTNIAIKCELSKADDPLPPEVEMNLFRIVQEALTNAERHARAKSIRLRLSRRNDSILLRIQDDGRGFNLEPSRSDEGKRRGTGLTNIRERAAFLGGQCEVESAPKRGTVITVRVPCDAST